MNCSTCKGPYHPASGHAWTAEVVVCGPCIRRFFAWVRSHTAGRRRGHDFYAAAATSIKAKTTGAPMSLCGETGITPAF